MAISQVSKGVYIVSPEKADTSGSRYVSLFTKQREEQWQLAQKQAALEADIATKTYSEQLKIYRDRIDAMNAQVRDLAKMKERAMAGALTAMDRAELESWRLQSRRDEKLAQRTPVSQGSTTETTRSSGAGGRGGKGPTLGDVSPDQEAEIQAALAESAGDPATAAAAVKARRDSKSLGAATPEDTDAQNYKVVNDLADMRVGATGEDIDTATDNILRELSQTDPQYAASHARYTAKQAEIEKGTGGGTTTTTTTRPGAKMEPTYEGLATKPGVGPEIPVESRETMLADIAAQRAALEQKIKEEQMPQFAGFDYITRAREIASGRFGPTSPSPAFGQRNALQALLRADPAMQQLILDQYRASLPAPATAVSAPATAAGGTASTGTAPAATAPAPTTTTPDARTRPPPQEPTPDFVMPPEEPFPMAPGQSAESLLAEAVDTGAAAGTPGLTPGGKSALERLAETKFKEAERRMAEESRIGAEIAASERPFQIPFEERGGETVPFFRKPGGLADQRAMEQAYFDIQDERQRRVSPTSFPPPAVSPVAPEAVAPVTPLAPAASVPEVTAVPPTDIRPEAAALMTQAEREQFMEELRARRAPSAIDVARSTRFTAPSQLPAPVRPQMTPPAGVVASLGEIRVPSGAVAPSTTSIGRYTPGPGPAPVAMAGPSTADAAPRSAAAAPEGYFDRPSRPLTANMGAQMAIREGEESAEATAAAKKQMADIKAVGAQDYFRGPTPSKKETKETYLFNRLQTAYPLAKKSDKLDRVIASGPGKVAYDLYVANKAKGIPFTKTYEEITMTFAGDRKAMEQGHSVALALDIKDNNTAPGGK
jgi:hypothetical protein